MLPQYRIIPEGNDFLAVRSIKRQIDGALGSHGAWLLENYVDMDSPGLVLEPVEDIEGTAAVAAKHGFQVNTHAIGDRANREVLDLYARTFKVAGVDGRELRWRIEHAQHIHPDDIPRFGSLGVVAAMQGVHATSDGPWVPLRLGDERAKTRTYVWRDLIDSGALVTNGSDVPVEDIDPIASYYASVTRIMADGAAFYPEQRMTREEALRSYTINSAYAAFEEPPQGVTRAWQAGRHRGSLAGYSRGSSGSDPRYPRRPDHPGRRGALSTLASDIALAVGCSAGREDNHLGGQLPARPSFLEPFRRRRRRVLAVDSWTRRERRCA